MTCAPEEQERWRNFGVVPAAPVSGRRRPGPRPAAGEGQAGRQEAGAQTRQAGRQKPAARRPRQPEAGGQAAPPRPRAEAVAKPPRPAPPPRRSTYADAVLLYERGLQALQAKRYRDAADTLKRVIAEFPEEIELHERAQLYIRVCERQLAPLDATPKTPEEQVYAATLAINTGAARSGGRAADRRAPAADADNDAAEYMLGVALAAKGDQHGALHRTWRARSS